jgi:hypothetical protein
LFIVLVPTPIQVGRGYVFRLDLLLELLAGLLKAYELSVRAFVELISTGWATGYWGDHERRRKLATEYGKHKTEIQNQAPLFFRSERNMHAYPIELMNQMYFII